MPMPKTLAQLHGDDKKEEPVPVEAGGAEGVHVLDPGAARTAGNVPDAFPSPFRTAFYAQQNLAQQ